MKERVEECLNLVDLVNMDGFTKKEVMAIVFCHGMIVSGYGGGPVTYARHAMIQADYMMEEFDREKGLPAK